MNISLLFGSLTNTDIDLCFDSNWFILRTWNLYYPQPISQRTRAHEDSSSLAWLCSNIFRSTSSPTNFSELCFTMWQQAKRDLVSSSKPWLGDVLVH